MAASKLRGIGSRIHVTLLSKRSMSFYKAKSGLLVPEGYEQKSPYDEIKGLFTQIWYKLDDSARTTIVETITKYAVATALGGFSFVLLNMSRAKHNTIEDYMKAANVNSITKAELESSEEKFHKQQQEINEKLLMVQEDLNNIKQVNSICLIRILAKNFDPKVLSRVKQEDLYDPVQVLKGKVNPIQVNLTKEEEWMTKLKVVFTLHDKNRDGFITTEELEDLLVFLGKRYSESVLKDIITKADVDLNRGVDFTQFLQIMENKDKDEEVETALKLTDNEDVRCVPGSQTCAVGKPRREAPGGS